MNKFRKIPTVVIPTQTKKIEKTVTFCNHCQFMRIYRENKPDTANWLMVCDYVDELGRQPEGNPFILRKGTDRNFGMNAIPSNCPLENYIRECEHKKRPRPPKPEEPEIEETGIVFDAEQLELLQIVFDNDEFEVTNIESLSAVTFVDGRFEFVEPTGFTFDVIGEINGVEEYYTITASSVEEGWEFTL
jgi:hypothetical protein